MSSGFLAKLARELVVTDLGIAEKNRSVTLQPGEYLLEKIPNPSGLCFPSKPNYWLVIPGTKRGMSVAWWEMRELEQVEVVEDGKKREVPVVVLTKIEKL